MMGGRVYSVVSQTKTVSWNVTFTVSKFGGKGGYGWKR